MPSADDLTRRAAAASQPSAVRIIRRWSRGLLILLAPLILASIVGMLNRCFDLPSNLKVQFMWAALVMTLGLISVRS